MVYRKKISWKRYHWEFAEHDRAKFDRLSIYLVRDVAGFKYRPRRPSSGAYK